jgi:hypothetical protein
MRRMRRSQPRKAIDKQLQASHNCLPSLYGAMSGILEFPPKVNALTSVFAATVEALVAMWDQEAEAWRGIGFKPTIQGPTGWRHLPSLSSICCLLDIR